MDSKDSRNLLAINGGRPTRETYLPYGRQVVTEDDILEVVKVLKSDWLTTGPKVTEFENAVANLVGAEHGVTFSSGTAALHAAVFAAGIGPGDEVITSPLTFCASANCVLYVGATPVFADIHPNTLNIDPAEIKSRLTPNTKAIIPVDYSGNPADLESILGIAEEHNLIVIEDAAHALGATYKDRHIGSISHMTMFSFHPVKHVTTGEGGLITTDNGNFARRLRMFRTHGIDQELRQRAGEFQGEWFYEMQELGYNYRLPDIACALGINQLSRLPKNLATRHAIATQYRLGLSDLASLDLPIESLDGRSAWHLYPIRLKSENLSVGRQEIFRALRKENIGVNVHYIPVHMHPYYQRTFGYKGGEFPVAEAAYEALITLPLFHSMNDQDILDVISATRKVLTHYTN